MSLHVESHVFSASGLGATSPSSSLQLTAKRYTKGSSARNVKGLTLLFAHCIGSHKEEWDIVIEALFHLQESKPEPFQIREAWSFDRQNHGDAAVLNLSSLKLLTEGVPLNEWSAALASFVRSPSMDGHRMVPIGHSAGTTAWTLTTLEFALHAIPYVAMIPVESAMVNKGVFERELKERMEYMDFVVSTTKRRRDHWPSREEAFRYFQKRYPWNMWDTRSIELLVKYGLHDTPDGKAVVLKCPKEQEAVSYPDTAPHFEGADRLGVVSCAIPVHVVWGERVEFIPEYIRDSLSDPSDGRRVASVRLVEDAGHMVVQEKPALLAQTISDILATIPPPIAIANSKL